MFHARQMDLFVDIQFLYRYPKTKECNEIIFIFGFEITQGDLVILIIEDSAIDQEFVQSHVKQYK